MAYSAFIRLVVSKKFLRALRNASNIYAQIKELILDYVEIRKREDETYSNTKFFKSEAAVGLIRECLRNVNKMTFIRSPT